MDVLRFPLARVTLLFVAGIAVQYRFGTAAAVLIATLAGSGCLLIAQFLAARKSQVPGTFFGCTAMCVAFTMGAFCLSTHSGIRRENHYIRHVGSQEKQYALQLTIREKLKATPSYERYVCRVGYIDGTPASGSILLNLRDRNKENHLATGSLLLLNAKVIAYRKPLNPNQFDYGRYLASKNIYAQAYADTVVVSGAVKDIFYYADALRQRTLTNLAGSGFRDRELQVFAALLLGQQQEINADIVRDYQFAGAVHILSVSGLHVGFVLLLLNFILGYLPKTKRWNLLKLCIVIAGLWGFAVIAGLSASVVRSVVMFSFVAAGMHLKRSANVFHTLLVSMLLILLFRPAFLFDVGFQLSYLAVFSIIWLQPVFTRSWNPENGIAKYFWNILTVSFAAQLGTLPLSLYYFHQFPGLFFVTNLIAIPLLSFIMAVGLVAAVWAILGTVPSVLIFSVQQSIAWLNEAIAFIAGFEKFIFRDVPFNTAFLLISYLLLLSIACWLKRPHFKELITVLCCTMLFQISWLWQNWSSQRQREWIVFHSPKNTITAIRNGNATTVKSHGKISRKAFLFTLQPYLTANFSQLVSSKKLQNLEFFSNKRIFVLDSASVIPDTADAAILLLTQSPKLNLDRFLLHHKPQIIIADGSNFRSYTKRWEATCRKQKIPFHATAEKGFYRLKEIP